MHYRAGERPGDAGHSLDLRDDHPAQVIHVVCLSPDDDVVRTRDVVSLGHAGYLADAEGYIRCLPDLGLDKNVCLHHVALHVVGVIGNATVGHSRAASHAVRKAPGRQRLGRYLPGSGPGIADCGADQEASLRTPATAVEIAGGLVISKRDQDVVTVADLGEFGLIAAISAVLPQGPAVLIGVGDDAAVLRASDGRVVASTDLLVEGRHFRRDWSGPRDVGVKAAAENLADVAAMGAVPTALLVGIATPGDVPADWVLDMTRGMVSECDRAGASLVGGDISSADAIMLGVTAFGDLRGHQPVTRGGARPGDLVTFCGRLGWSAAGLALLRAGRSADTLPADLAELISAHRRPRPVYAAGPQAGAAGATSMIDVSDGLVADLGHICDASGVSIDVDSSSLPVTEAMRAAAGLLGADWLEWTLAGGEDHALAATFPSEAVIPEGWRTIGEVREGRGVLVDSVVRTGPAGWDHFR